MARMFGVPEENMKSFATPDVDVWPCNWNTVQLFMAMSTQWRVSMNGPIGLDYVALPVVSRALGIRITPKRMAGIRIMESEALTIFSQRQT